MTALLLAFLLGASRAAAQDVPFFPRETGANQDLGGINQNFNDVANRSTCRMTTTVTPKSCPAGQTLTGACYSHGAVSGGTCTTVATSGPALASTQTWSGLNTFTNPIDVAGGWNLVSSATFSGVTSTTITIPAASSTTYSLHFYPTVSAADQMIMTVNSDPGNNYRHNSFYSSAGGETRVSSNGGARGVLSDGATGNGLAANDDFYMDMRFVANNASLKANFSSGYQGTGNSVSATGWIGYSGASVISKINIAMLSGTMTGFYQLMRLK